MTDGLRVALDELIARASDPMASLFMLNSARSKVEEMFRALRDENERLQREIKAMSEMYTQVTSPLQECCQRHRLGLGGELCHELVIEEVDRLRRFETYVCQVIAMGQQADLTVEALPK